MVEVNRQTFQPFETFTQTIKGEMQMRTTTVATLEDEVIIEDDRIRLIPSLRVERYTDRTQPFETVRRDMVTYNRDLTDTSLSRTLLAGSIGIAARPVTGLVLKANAGRYYRTPSLMELFGYRGMTLPNPGLKPEMGFNRDIGFVWEPRLKRSHLRVEAAYFWSDVSDLILYVFVPFAQTSQAINVDSAEIEGLEIALSAGRWRGFSIDFNLTHLDAINTGPVSYSHGKKLPNRPDLEASGRLSWHGRWLRLYYEYDHISGNYWNLANDRAPNNKGPLLPTRNVHNAGITVELSDGLQLRFDVSNLTDRHYEDVIGYPLPGRSMMVSVDYEMR